MMEIVSQGSVRVGKLVWRSGHGQLAFTVVCKATFELCPGVSPLADVQEPLFETDTWTPEGTSLRLATDLVPFKQRPEVLVVGHAHAPRGQAVASLVARLVVGEIDKSILVVGDREILSDGRFGEPTPFVQMPLVWERSAGGPNTDNPAGNPANRRAFAPNLYSLQTPSVAGTSTFVPIGVAPIAPQWPSRLARLRQHSNDWDVSRWYERPLPADIDLAFLNAAPADQQRTAPFSSDDTIFLENLHPELPRLSTRLEPFLPQATVYRTSGPEQLKLRCDTLIIDTDRGLASLVWRAHVLLDELGQTTRVVVSSPGNNAAPTAPTTNIHADDSEEVMTLPPMVRQAKTIPFTPGIPSAIATSAPSSVPTKVEKPAVPSGDSEETNYIVPGTAQRAALPFAPGTASAIAAPASSPVPAPIQRPAAPSGDSEETNYIVPGTAQRAALPFAPGAPSAIATSASSSPTNTPPSPVVQAPAWIPSSPVMAEPNLGSSPWGYGSPIAPTAPTPAVNIAPTPVAAPAPTPAPIPTKEAAPPGDDPELRLRDIQRAIWKGDRPLEKILQDHGMTEIEWRAMKRRFARRQDA